MKRALITGASGFIGSHFMKRLLLDGWTVRSVDVVDPSWPLDCREFFRFHGHSSRFELVIHCAATIPSVDKRAANGLSVAEDFSIDAEFFQWLLRARPLKTCYFSSSAAYPTHLQTKPYKLVESDIDLDDIRSPDGMYGLTKLVGEVQAREARKTGLDILVVRPQSGYGTDQSLNYPFPSMIQRAKRRLDPFEVWGTGQQVRDFIHVDDVVGCVLAMLEADCQGPVNIGSGVGTSMLELAQLVSENYGPTVQTLPDKPIGTPYRCADTTLMETFYKPTVTLEEGIRRALAGII
jgi:nucleoside-diphosphate-sugar epimerase